MKRAFVYALVLVAAIILTGFAILYGASKYESSADYSAECEYKFNIIDVNNDGFISRDELERFQQLQIEEFESWGALRINENGELEVADKFARDEEARAEFEKRQQLKN